jgi:hypothetical protein
LRVAYGNLTPLGIDRTELQRIGHGLAWVHPHPKVADGGMSWHRLEAEMRLSAQRLREIVASMK